ncbi:Hsp20/alpha crystallin family protein [Arthrobacter sp. zg-Y820]|nr:MULTISPECIES: Hsp20/alpha crystallin family protein [unclassified Arthrobacter]WIB08294.1 Hsp20/alpha crystallin family protein [Arthrobacter sp. zg-Y820]
MVFRFDPAPGLDLFDPLCGSPGAADDSDIPVDLYREGDHYIVNADLPGLDPGSLHLDVEGRLLTVSGHRTLRDLSGARWLVRDRRRGLVQRQILLGSDINAAGISARYDCGILSLYLPVDPNHRRRKIPVQYG